VARIWKIFHSGILFSVTAHLYLGGIEGWVDRAGYRSSSSQPVCVCVGCCRFSCKMCPVINVTELTLDMLWSAGLQLVVFYHYTHQLVSRTSSCGLRSLSLLHGITLSLAATSSQPSAVHWSATLFVLCEIFDHCQPIAAKFCTTTGSLFDFIIPLQNFRVTLKKKLGGPKHAKIWHDFGPLQTLMVNISGADEDIQNRTSTWSTVILPTFGNENMVNFGPLISEISSPQVASFYVTVIKR